MSVLIGIDTHSGPSGLHHDTSGESPPRTHRQGQELLLSHFFSRYQRGIVGQFLGFERSMGMILTGRAVRGVAPLLGTLGGIASSEGPRGRL